MTYIIVIILIALSGIFSGLTLGFFSLNKDDLRRKAELGNKQAQKVYKIRVKGNLLLCTLLVGNVAVNSTLAIFLGSIASGLLAGLISTVLIVIFGEILPQATFSRHALALGAKLSWLVRLFIIILSPICVPLAWMLDKILGKEAPTVYSKKELIKMVEHHEDLGQSDIDEDEEKIVRGALSYSSKQVKDVMTPRKKVFTLKAGTTINDAILEKIKSHGSSRIPILKEKGDTIIGLLYVKDLIVDQHKNELIETVARPNVIFVNISTPLDDVLNQFRQTRSHLFIALDNAKKFAGIITIEDVIEEIIGKDIQDEFDTNQNG